MSVRFLNGTQDFDAGFCLRNLNLLAHAQAIELDIGSECGGHGACGGDRIKLPPGARVSPVTMEEKHHFSDAELAQGWRLACQCFPEQDDDTLPVTTALITPPSVPTAAK